VIFDKDQGLEVLVRALVEQLLDGRPLVGCVNEFSDTSTDADFESTALNRRKLNGVLRAATQPAGGHARQQPYRSNHEELGEDEGDLLVSHLTNFTGGRMSIVWYLNYRLFCGRYDMVRKGTRMVVDFGKASVAAASRL
jgi:hypothetical protein